MSAHPTAKPIIMVSDYLESYSMMPRTRAEAIAQGTSKWSSYSGTSSSTKQVTWKDASYSDNSMHRISIPKRFFATMEVLKRKLRRLETEKTVMPLFATKPQASPTPTPPQGILKAPTLQFSTHTPGWLDSRPEEHGVPYTDSDLDSASPLSSPSEGDDTPTSSALSTPLGSVVRCEEWVIESDFEENEDYFTPKLPSGWSSLPYGYKWPTKDTGLTMSASMYNLVGTTIDTTMDSAAGTGPVEIIVLDTAPDMEAKRLDAKLCQSKPRQIKDTLEWDYNRHPAGPDQSAKPIQTPGEFLDNLASSLQYYLVICGLGLMALLALMWCAVLVITSGALVISVFPGVALTYGLVYTFTRAKYSLRSILATTIGLGGGLVLGIWIGIVLVVELVRHGIEALCVSLRDNLPVVAGLFMTEASIYDVLPNSIKVLLAL